MDSAELTLTVILNQPVRRYLVLIKYPILPLVPSNVLHPHILDMYNTGQSYILPLLDADCRVHGLKSNRSLYSQSEEQFQFQQQQNIIFAVWMDLL